jgi:hypothetical protein
MVKRLDERFTILPPAAAIGHEFSEASYLQPALNILVTDHCQAHFPLEPATPPAVELPMNIA